MSQYIIVNEARGPYEALGAILCLGGKFKEGDELLSMYYVCGEETHTYPTLAAAVEACEEMREEYNNDQLVVYRCERIPDEEYENARKEIPSEEV